MLRLSGKTGIIVLLCLASFVGLPSLAQDAASPRLKIGINLLPAIIAANQSLAASDGSPTSDARHSSTINPILPENLNTMTRC